MELLTMEVTTYCNVLFTEYFFLMYSLIVGNFHPL